MNNLVNGFKTLFIRCIRTTRLRKRSLNNTIWQQCCSARHSQGNGQGSGYKTECVDHSGERVFRGPHSMHVKDLSCRCRKRVYAHVSLYSGLFLSPLTKLSIPHDFHVFTSSCLEVVSCLIYIICAYKGRSHFNCGLYDFSSYVSIHSQISFHRKLKKQIN